MQPIASLVLALLRWAVYGILIGATLVGSLEARAQSAWMLFDGATLNGWEPVHAETGVREWNVVDGMLHLTPEVGKQGDIFTDLAFDDFCLEFEWRVAPGGNNGIKYRVRQYGSETLGFEYQMIDNQSLPDAADPLHRAGALYDLYEVDTAKLLAPPGKFNQSRIVARGYHVEHWLNGHCVVRACLCGPDWCRRLAASKFSDVPGFARHRCGRIMLTDHDSEVWYRSILLYPLPPTGGCPSELGSGRCALHSAIVGGPVQGIAGCWQWSNVSSVGCQGVAGVPNAGHGSVTTVVGGWRGIGRRSR